MNRFSIARKFHHRKTVLSGLSRLSALLLLCLLLLGTVHCGGDGGGAVDGTNTGILIGPGDPDNYFPLEQGNTWITKGLDVSSQTGTTEFYSITKISGNEVIDGKTAAVRTKIWIARDQDSGWLKLEPDRWDTYLFKDDNSITFWGKTDPPDSQYVPYMKAKFPLAAGSGSIETASIYSQVTAQEAGSISLPLLGAFSPCISMETNVQEPDNTAKETEWFAPGIGSIKSQKAGILTYATGTATVTETITQTEDLIGYNVAGIASRVTPLTVESLSSGSVKGSSVDFYIVAVTPDINYAVTLTGTSGTKPNFFALNGNTALYAQYQTENVIIGGPDSVLYIMVDNRSAEDAGYSIQVSEQVTQQ